MSFLSVRFGIFFLILLLIMKATSGAKAHQRVLLAASYVFYAAGDWRFLILLAGVSLAMWQCGLKIARAAEKENGGKAWLVLGVSLDLLVLGVFKYAGFFADTFSAVFRMPRPVLRVVLPLGLSFYIFQAISYLADVYMGKMKAESSLRKVLLYIGFFPQIVSGPIVKARDFFPQLERDHELTWENLSWGGQRLLTGLFKKVVVADRLGVCVDAVYAAPAAYSGLSILTAVFAYSLQIYYDFSGYSDMAMGIARMLGFDLGKNFNLPYLAASPSEFWRRWHISLSSWFRDYVYIPLGGNRKGKVRTYLNLFLTMLLSGLWHGASWAFVAWGALHGAASVLYKAHGRKKKGENSGFAVWEKVRHVFSVILNFCVVSFLWIPFRTSDFGKTFLILRRIFTWTPGIHYVYVYALIFGAGLLVTELMAVRLNQGNDIWRPLDLSRFGGRMILCCFVLLTAVFAYIGDNAFIYAQF